ncbi:hypothetical protein MMC25_004563 [Agyrium rufum]|nr:hypothetical protein [Agyrium rufum]
MARRIFCCSNRVASSDGSEEKRSVPSGKPAPPSLARRRTFGFPTKSFRDFLPKQNTAAVRHERYLKTLKVPTLEQIVAIARVQGRKEEEVEEKYAHMHDASVALDGEGGQKQQDRLEPLSQQDQEKAAGTIQRTYRGYRERRQLNGMGLDPSTRWTEAIREAQYRNLTLPRPRTSENDPAPPPLGRKSSEAHKNWQRVVKITHRAQGDREDDSDSDSTASTRSSDSQTPSERARRRQRREKNVWKGKMMDLPYFLEMVDQKHRYGSNLRAYHTEWKTADTHENFFYWLDYGEGKNIDLQMCSRERLDREQVRYLSREERMDYLVNIDSEGRLCWAKNGERIDTTMDWRDSMHGIVRKDDLTPRFREKERGLDSKGTSHKSHEPEDGDASDSTTASDLEAAQRYPDDLNTSKGPKKILHVSPATIFNQLLRSSVKKNTWIFVADISMNLYVGIKQSGAFQHSSFIHGSRISAAGQIKIKRGQLRSLSPLSGHYRPPTKAFKHFIAHLKEEHTDMSRVSISKSYAVLVGLEGYMTGKKKLTDGLGNVRKGIERVVNPEEAKRKKAEQEDRSQSARLEREKIEQEKRDRWDLKKMLNLPETPSRSLSRESTSPSLAGTKTKGSVDGSRGTHIPGIGIVSPDLEQREKRAEHSDHTVAPIDGHISTDEATKENSRPHESSMGEERISETNPPLPSKEPIVPVAPMPAQVTSRQADDENVT